jgi:hypothetical protein
MKTREISPAECPCCGQNIVRVEITKSGVVVGQRYCAHNAPCGLPCKLRKEAKVGEVTHDITEECTLCQSSAAISVQLAC